MLDPTYPLFPVFAFLGFVLALVSLPWHMQAWNAGTCAYMLWTATACLIEFVNSIVWRDNAIIVAPVWCDISTKLLLGAGVGIPASSLCICRRLYKIASAHTTSISHQDKRRVLAEDLCIATGIPVLVMTLHTVVQGHRFDIYENVGCYPVIDHFILTYFLIFMWPILLGCVSFVFSALTLHAFWKRRIQFAQFISSDPSMNSNRYVRLMILAVVEMMCTIPIGIYSMYISTQGVELRPWISWADTHFQFGYIGQFPAVEWRADHAGVTSITLTMWLPVICGFLFFALFGFAPEAKRNYAAGFWRVANRFGFSPPAAKGSLLGFTNSSNSRWKFAPKLNPNASVGSLPVFTSSRSVDSKPRPASTISSSCSATHANYDYDIENNAGQSSSTLQVTTPATFVFLPLVSDNATAHHSLTVELDYSRHISFSESEAFPISVPPTPIVPSDVDPSEHEDDDSDSSIPEPAAVTEPHAESSSKPNPESFTPYHRPFTSPNVYPTALPFSSQRRTLNPIQVVVHTELHETL